MIRDNFAAFILSHGRADNMLTLNALKECGYTGKWYIIIDNEDEQGELYKERFGSEHVIVFDKLEESKKCDTCDTPFAKRNVILFARNASFGIAKDLGLDYFIELDDDYTTFRYRYIEGGSLKTSYVTDMDSVMEAMLDFLDESGSLTVAMSQTGDFIGGVGCCMLRDGHYLHRKAMNSFFCRTDRPFKFIGRVNEDVNTYLTLGSRGNLFFTFAQMSLNQAATQQSKGGMTTTYLDQGTYTKTFYTVMMMPSCTKVSIIGYRDFRMHHCVDWEHGVPKIISERFRK